MTGWWFFTNPFEKIWSSNWVHHLPPKFGVKINKIFELPLTWQRFQQKWQNKPKQSMYGIFTYIYHILPLKTTIFYQMIATFHRSTQPGLYLRSHVAVLSPRGRGPDLWLPRIAVLLPSLAPPMVQTPGDVDGWNPKCMGNPNKDLHNLPNGPLNLNK